MIARRRRKGRRMIADSELLLAAMVDMMVNVLLFLLTLYGSGPGAGLDEFELAEARTQEPIEGDIHLTITPRLVALDGAEVLRLNVGADGIRLPSAGASLDALQAQLHTRLGDAQPPPLAVEIDRRVPWSVVRPLLDLATQAGFTDLRFSVSSVSAPSGTR